jgi:hypothetical protein
MIDPPHASGERSRAIQAAAVLYALNGAGFGIGAALSGWYFARNGELPMTPFGFRSLSGPFERLGPDRLLALTWALVGLCAVDVLTGAWLGQGRRRGAAAGLASAPFALVLGAGFALPFLLAVLPIRLILMWVGRRSLR